MYNLKIGDYVLATKYNDGDPKDHWCIGFYNGVLKLGTTTRYLVIDNDGNQFRANGFRRIKKISGKRGTWILDHKFYIEHPYLILQINVDNSYYHHQLHSMILYKF